jgi:hypothetical protein
MKLGASAVTPLAGSCMHVASPLPLGSLAYEVRGHASGQVPGRMPGQAHGQVPGGMPGQAPGHTSGPPSGHFLAASAGRLGEQFARALNEQGGDDDKPPLREAEPPSGLLQWPPAPATPPVASAPPSAPSAGAHRATADSVTAAARLHDIAAVAPATVTQADAGQVWELSLNEPDGLVLSVRAERVAMPVSASGMAPPQWTLSINAPAAEAAALQRHAPRLAERLAARALAPAHMRIAGDRDSLGE